MRVCHLRHSRSSRLQRKQCWRAHTLSGLVRSGEPSCTGAHIVAHARTLQSDA